MVDEPSNAPDEVAAVLRQMRTRVEAAAAEIDALTTEVIERNRIVDELESLVDALLDVAGARVVVVGGDRRIKAVSRLAAKGLGVVDPVGRPLSAVLPEDVAGQVMSRLDQGTGPDTEEPGGVRVQPLAGGDLLVVLDAS